MEAATSLIDSIAKLAGAMVWPALLLFFVIRFRPAIGDFFASVAELSWKGGGIEASVKRTQTQVAAALTAAVASRPESAPSPNELAEAAKAAVTTSSEAVTAQVLRRTKKTRLLWVDDRPQNNIHERDALEALGIDVEISVSTDDALLKTRNAKYDVIISDMGRPPDMRAGYTLLDALRSAGDRTPFVIYAGSGAIEHQAEARAHGALGSTNRATELLNLVLSAIRQSS